MEFPLHVNTKENLKNALVQEVATAVQAEFRRIGPAIGHIRNTGSRAHQWREVGIEPALIPDDEAHGDPLVTEDELSAMKDAAAASLKAAKRKRDEDPEEPFPRPSREEVFNNEIWKYLQRIFEGDFPDVVVDSHRHPWGK
eukprot:6461819-Amphidinium_carterae.1